MRRIVVLFTAWLCAAVACVIPSAAAATSPLPADPAANGYVGLCNEKGQNVTGGDINTAPFIWKAVSSTHPPANYQGPGQNAVLNIYQPRPLIEPAEWSGLSLTSATFYANAKHPSVQSTYADQPLAHVVKAFPPLVDGLYVLRIYYGKANYGLYSGTYPTTVIQVVGTTWHVVSGGTVDCGASTGRSNEDLTGVVAHAQIRPHATTPPGQTIVATKPGAAGAAVSSSPSPLGTTTVPPSVTATPASAGAGARDGTGISPTAARTDDSGGHGWVWLVVVPGALLVVLGAAVVLRLRRPTSSSG